MNSSRSTVAGRRLSLAISAFVVVAMAIPASADIDQSPNSIPFGPSVCEDGRSFDVSYSPTDPSPVGMNLDSNQMGVSKRLDVIIPTTSDPLGDHILLETVYDRPGKGLDKNTVRCVAPFGDGIWLAFEVNFNK